MNYYDYEINGEYNRQRIVTEIDQIRLEEFALDALQDKTPSKVEPIIIRLANWLISEGMQLRKQFEAHTRRHKHFPASHIPR
jgi:hypothetical protein